jgi:adenylate cyclase
MLNDFFRVTVRVVEQDHGGMVNKYLGDGFMAIFGADADDSQSNHPQDACAAGQQILVAVEELNRELMARGRAPLRIGVGIHSGPAIVGSIGSPKRLEFTAIANTANVASRIETLTKTVGRPMLVTAAVRERLGDSSDLEDLGPQEVCGVSKPMVVFAPRSQV